MGADIYLNSESEKCKEKWQPIFNDAVARRDAANKAGNQQLAEEIQKEVSKAYDGMYSKGYFRDSYNSTSLFWVLGLSWWKLADELCDEERNLPIEKAKELLKLVTKGGEHDFTDERFDAWVAKNKAEQANFFTAPYYGETKPRDEAKEIAAWKAFFARKHKAWCAMLRKSIRLKEPLHWSV